MSEESYDQMREIIEKAVPGLIDDSLSGNALNADTIRPLADLAYLHRGQIVLKKSGNVKTDERILSMIQEKFAEAGYRPLKGTGKLYTGELLYDASDHGKGELLVRAGKEEYVVSRMQMMDRVTVGFRQAFSLKNDTI